MRTTAPKSMVGGVGGSVGALVEEPLVLLQLNRMLRRRSIADVPRAETGGATGVPRRSTDDGDA